MVQETLQPGALLKISMFTLRIELNEFRGVVKICLCRKERDVILESNYLKCCNEKYWNFPLRQKLHCSNPPS